MTATLSKTQAELPRLVEIASQGEDVLITVNGEAKVRLTRAHVSPVESAPPREPLDLTARVQELASLREKYRAGKVGLTVDQILDETRADRQ